MINLLIGLAVWRITSFLVKEDGPYCIFVKFRHFIGIRYDKFSKPYGKNVIAEGFTCVWCLSVWISIALAWLSPNAVNVHMYIITVLALSTFAIVVDALIEYLVQ